MFKKFMMIFVLMGTNLSFSQDNYKPISLHAKCLCKFADSAEYIKLASLADYLRSTAMDIDNPNLKANMGIIYPTLAGMAIAFFCILDKKDRTLGMALATVAGCYFPLLKGFYERVPKK